MKRASIVIGLALVGMLAFAGTAQAAMDLSYVDGITVVKTWAAVPEQTAQWDDWTNWDGGNSIDAAGNKILGMVEDPYTRGAIYINDIRGGDLAALSYKNSGMALAYTRGAGESSSGGDVYLEMFTWNGDISGGTSLQQRLGFIIEGQNDGTGARTRQQFEDGRYFSSDWDETEGAADFNGTHTLALVLEDMGVVGKVDVVSYFDGVEKNRFEADDPLGELTKLGVGYEYTGNYYAKRGTVVSEITAFTVPEPATMALLAFGGLTLLRRRRRA